ncbi:MAG: ECF-type sigma factor [Bacteroidota bacterium]
MSTTRPSSGDVTQVLRDLQRGDPVPDDAFAQVYDVLHRAARQQRARWNGNETLNTTALVHEAYVKLIGKDYADREHFLAVASKAMRHLLVNYAERQAAQKRGGGQAPVPLDEVLIASPERAADVLALEEALVRLEAFDPRAASVVECRFFGGLDAAETAEALGVSRRTVTRDWGVARAWLFAELSRDFLDGTI